MISPQVAKEHLDQWPDQVYGADFSRKASAAIEEVLDQYLPARSKMDSMYPAGVSNNDSYFTDESECRHIYPNYECNDPRELEAECVVCGDPKYPERYEPEAFQEMERLRKVTGLESRWLSIETIPKDGTTFRAYSPDLVHPDFNPWGSVECVFDGEQFIGAVWDGQFDCWNTVVIEPTLWMPIPDSPSCSKLEARSD